MQSDIKKWIGDLQTRKIEFVIDCYHNGRLYATDTNDTLHIFAEE